MKARISSISNSSNHKQFRKNQTTWTSTDSRRPLLYACCWSDQLTTVAAPFILMSGSGSLDLESRLAWNMCHTVWGFRMLAVIDVQWQMPAWFKLWLFSSMPSKMYTVTNDRLPALVGAVVPSTTLPKLMAFECRPLPFSLTVWDPKPAPVSRTLAVLSWSIGNCQAQERGCWIAIVI